MEELTGIGLSCLLIVGLVFGGRACDRHYDEKACDAFGRETARTVEFVDYHFWAWDCLTPTQDGKRISTTRLRDVE